MGYGADGGEADEVVDRAQAEVLRGHRAAHQRGLPAARPTSCRAPSTRSRRSRNRGGAMIGVPTGFADLDDAHQRPAPRPDDRHRRPTGHGQGARTRHPAAHAARLDDDGRGQVGDQLLDGDGRPTRVVAATDVMVGRPCYEVAFSDGTVIVADAQHQWLTQTRASRRGTGAASAAGVRTTEEIAATLRCATSDRRANHSVDNTRALDLPARTLPLPPYALGVWLGDGTTDAAHYTSADPEIAMHIEAEGLRWSPPGSRCATACGCRKHLRWRSAPASSAAPTSARRPPRSARAAVDVEELPGGPRRLPLPPAPTAGGQARVCSCARRAATSTGPSRRSCGRWACWATSTSRATTCGPPRRSGVTCWPVCSTPMGRSRRSARSSSR